MLNLSIFLPCISCQTIEISTKNALYRHANAITWPHAGRIDITLIDGFLEFDDEVVIFERLQIRTDFATSF